MNSTSAYTSKILLIELHDAQAGIVQLTFNRYKTLCRLNSIEEQKKAASELGLSQEGVLDAVLRFIETNGTSEKFFVRTLQSSSGDVSFNSVNAQFPGISRDYLSCLISSTTSKKETPFIICTGPSGAGKSGTVHVAANVLGFKVCEEVWTGSPSQAVKAMEKASGMRAGFLLFDEFMKYARPNDANILNAALLLTRTRFAWCPPIIFTDIRCPEGLTQLRQISRRSRFFHLDHRVYWSNPGEEMRNNLRRAAEGLITECYRQNWRVEKNDEKDFWNLFEAVSAAPILALSDRQGGAGCGWKLIPIEHIHSQYHPICVAWKKISDLALGGSVYESTRIYEVSLSQIFQVDYPVHCEFKKSLISSDILIRFVVRHPEKGIIYNELG